MMNRVITLLGAVILCVVIGLALPHLLSPGVKSVTDYGAGDWQLENQQSYVSIVETPTDTALDVRTDVGQVVAVQKTQPADKGADTHSVTDENEAMPLEVEITKEIEDELVPAGNDVIVLEGDEAVPVYTGYDFLDEAIHKNQDMIDPEDLTIGLRLMKQLDMAFLLGLAASGMTETNQLKAKTYLDTVLNAEEVAVMMRLLHNYAYLL